MRPDITCKACGTRLAADTTISLVPTPTGNTRSSGQRAARLPLHSPGDRTLEAGNKATVITPNHHCLPSLNLLQLLARDHAARPGVTVPACQALGQAQTPALPLLAQAGRGCPRAQNPTPTPPQVLACTPGSPPGPGNGAQQKRDPGRTQGGDGLGVGATLHCLALSSPGNHGQEPARGLRLGRELPCQLHSSAG